MTRSEFDQSVLDMIKESLEALLEDTRIHSMLNNIPTTDLDILRLVEIANRVMIENGKK